MLISSQTIGSLGPLIEFNQLLSMLLIIDMDLPDTVVMIYSKFNLVSSININFVATAPLTVINDKSLFVPSSENYRSQGYEFCSFVYNIESQLITYFLLYILYLGARRLIPKCANKTGRIWSIIKKVLTFLCKANAAIIELYYQQRMIFYFSLFHFTAHRFSYKSIRTTASLIMAICDGLFIMAFLLGDAIFLSKYNHYIKSSFYKRTSKADTDFLAIHTELPLQKALKKKPIVIFLLMTLLIQVAIPFIITSISLEYIKCAIAGALMLLMLFVVVVILKISTNVKQLICITTNYVCLLVFCILWLIGSFLKAEFKDNAGYGWSMSILILIPTVVTMGCYLPQNLKEIKQFLCSLFGGCRKHKRAESRSA